MNLKLQEISKIIEDYHNKICPYCHISLHEFMRHKKKSYGCDNHQESLRITKEDYLYSIEQILKYGDNKIKNFRKLSEF